MYKHGKGLKIGEKLRRCLTSLINNPKQVVENTKNTVCKFGKCPRSILLRFFKNKHRPKIGRNRVFLMLWERSENQFSQPKEKVDIIFESFLNIRNPPPPVKKLNRADLGFSRRGGGRGGLRQFLKLSKIMSTFSLG